MMISELQDTSSRAAEQSAVIAVWQSTAKTRGMMMMFIAVLTILTRD